MWLLSISGHDNSSHSQGSSDALMEADLNTYFCQILYVKTLIVNLLQNYKITCPAGYNISKPSTLKRQVFLFRAGKLAKFSDCFHTKGGRDGCMATELSLKQPLVNGDTCLKSQSYQRFEPQLQAKNQGAQSWKQAE